MVEKEKALPARSFYGRRKGQALRGRKQRFMDESLPQLLIDLTKNPPADLSELFNSKSNALRLEIGFGGGEHLTHQALQNPQVNFIGVEPFINGMAKMLGSIDDHGLQNVRLYDDDAVALLDWLPSASIDQIDLLYPDPWPKKRHWKRRFVSQANLERFHRVLVPAGKFRFASDIDTYINWTLQHIQRHNGFEWLAKTRTDWNDPWEGWIRTRYEAKAIREGRPPCYLEFQKR